MGHPAITHDPSCREISNYRFNTGGEIELKQQEEIQREGVSWKKTDMFVGSMFANA